MEEITDKDVVSVNEHTDKDVVNIDVESKDDVDVEKCNVLEENESEDIDTDEFKADKDKLEMEMKAEYEKRLKYLKEEHLKKKKEKEKEEIMNNASVVISAIIEDVSQYKELDTCVICLGLGVIFEVKHKGTAYDIGKRLYSFFGIDGFCNCCNYYCAECICSMLRGYSDNRFSFKCVTCDMIMLINPLESEIKGLKGKKRRCKDVKHRDVIGKSFPFRLKSGVNRNNNNSYTNDIIYQRALMEGYTPRFNRNVSFSGYNSNNNNNNAK